LVKSGNVQEAFLQFHWLCANSLQPVADNPLFYFQKGYTMEDLFADVKNSIISGLFWKLLERGGSQAVQFFVQLFLARLLFPQDYGVLALLVIFITLAQVFVQSGLGISLIQKKEIDEVDFSSVFYISLAIAGLLYGVLYLAAPAIAGFYDQPQVIPVLRVMALMLFPGALNAVQNAVISRTMQFKKLFYSSIASMILSGIVGLAMAYGGYGLWALVFQQLTNQICITLILFFTVRWRPRLQFSFLRVSILFSFGWKLLVSSLIDTAFTNIRSLFIGKLYSPSILGYYNRGEQFPQLLVNTVNGSIQSVLLPALSAQQDYTERVKAMVRRSIVTSSFLVFPMMMGLAVIAKPLVLLLLTEKWLPAVPFLQMFCASYALWPIHTANLQAINAMGRSDIFLKLELIKKTLGILILLASLPFGVYVLAAGQIVNGLISSFINAQPNRKLLDYSYFDQMKDILPSFLLSLFMGIVTYSLVFLNLVPMATMLLQMVVGSSVYFLSARLFKLECYVYLKEILFSLIRSKAGKP
jgi:O-antigen/teichoic acid export membrane protein